MSESTNPHPQTPDAPGPAASASSRLAAAKLVFALACCGVAGASVYRGLKAPEEPFKDPVTIQAEKDRADPIVDEKDVMEGSRRTRTVTHKSGKVNVFVDDLDPAPLPTSPGGPSRSSGKAKANGKGAPKKKADDAKSK